MHMVFFAVKLDKFSFKVLADTVKNFFKVFKNSLRKNPITVFCDKDQMCMKEKNAVSSCANVVDFFHRPNILVA